uniref:Uncharacterized protein n=1 Tax=Octopus bimaculoides TaxID=37653 RepID=A0A0L8H0G0_OCTBM
MKLILPTPPSNLMRLSQSLNQIFLEYYPTSLMDHVNVSLIPGSVIFLQFPTKSIEGLSHYPDMV